MGKVRAAGSTHSFTPLISDGQKTGNGVESAVVSLRQMPRTWDLDSTDSSLTVDAGTTYGEIAAGLAGTGFALPNTASLPQFSVAGATATGTHGSGGLGADGRVTLGSLPSQVTAVELVGADGEVHTVSRGDDAFAASVVSLGLMGVATRFTLTVVPDYNVRQRVYGTWPPTGESGSLGATLDSLPEAVAQTDSLSVFVDWSVDDGGMLVMRDMVAASGSAAEPPSPEWHGLPLATAPLTTFLAEGTSWETSTTGRWHDRMHNWVR